MLDTIDKAWYHFAMFDEITKASILYDFYGELLSKRQREVVTLYYEDNLSITEIAENICISRQGVHDALKNAEKSLAKYEQKLGLVAKLEDMRGAVQKIDKKIDTILTDDILQEATKKELLQIKKIIDELEENI